jgi:hypothetical protein
MIERAVLWLLVTAVLALGGRSDGAGVAVQRKQLPDQRRERSRDAAELVAVPLLGPGLCPATRMLVQRISQAERGQQPSAKAA